MKNTPISHVAIYPPIGIARIGNSDEYFMAPDQPGVAPMPENGDFKDRKGRVKKQVARFRIYAFNAKNEVIGEINAGDGAQIDWRVHVANVKAAWYQFNNALDLPGYSIPSAPRNENISGKAREQLVIDPGSVSISGINRQGNAYHLNKGQFFGKNVKLGELRTDEQGRLLFFGGDGDSASAENAPAITFANNDGWHDDTCDGTVRATVTVGGKTFEALPAMVAVTPPNFAPGLYGVVTMDDVVQDLFIREMGYPDSAAAGVEFYTHIYPILERMTQTQWVNSGFFMLFGKNSPSDFTDPKNIAKLADPSDAAKAYRKRVFDWFRDPDSRAYEPSKIPALYGDGFGEYEKIALDDLPITRMQYARLKKWAAGAFKTTPPAKPVPFERLTPLQQIDALNRAPMEECLGGPFHPGIEITWPMRVKIMWQAPYRLNTVAEGESTRLDFGPLLAPAIALDADGSLAQSGPGSLTRWLGVPWQTDEASCLSGYTSTYYLPLPSFWAARVPNQVFSNDSHERMADGNLNIAQRLKHLDYRQDWLRDFSTQYQKKINSMVAQWHELGIIVADAQAMPNNTDNYLPDRSWKETGRNFSEPDPTFEQVLYAEGVEKSTARKMVLKSTVKPAGKPRTTFRRDER